MTSTSVITRMMLATKAIGKMATSMIVLCRRDLVPMMYMNKVPRADRLNIECRPEQASATWSWYGPIDRITPLRAIG